MGERTGRLFVISSPSGGGKSTIIQSLLKRQPRLEYSISATTRLPRADEREGSEYFFLDEPSFLNKIASDEFLEWAKVHGDYYGTLKDTVVKVLSEGKDLVLDVDVQGGLCIKQKCPESVLIFIMPPSLAELEKRLRDRGTESETVLQRRLGIAEKEMKAADQYDFQVWNIDLDRTVEEIETIILKNDARIR